MEYKDCTIKGFEGLYRIYENGDIYSMRKQKFIKQHPNGVYYKYMYVCLTGHNKQQLRTGVHRIVALHWIGQQPKNHQFLGEYEINHIDCNKLNNHYSNLEWVLHRDNILKAQEYRGIWCNGRKSGFNHSEHTRLLMSEAKKIKCLLFNDSQEVIKDSIQETANYLNVSRRTIERHINSYTTLKGFKIKSL
jgi:transcriptional regulator with AAA-type ATPase domain